MAKFVNVVHPSDNRSYLLCIHSKSSSFLSEYPDTVCGGSGGISAVCFLLTQFWALTGQLHGLLSTALAGVRCLAASNCGTIMFLCKL